MASSNNYFVLNKDNPHLLDIFSENYYLELGNINSSSLTRLLKNKVVRYENLTYFDIQNKGIGASNVNSDGLKEVLPYYYFENLCHKEVNKQLFITYGIYIQRHGYKEYFTPILLIPVDMIVNGKEISFKLNGNVIENPYLPAFRRNFDLETKRVRSIYDLDDFCIENFKNGRNNLRLESYLTFAEVNIPNAYFDNDKFSIDGIYNSNIDNYYDTNRDLCYVTTLNDVQRKALYHAHFGSSFAITGLLGTGKTRSLINIASDAIYNNKKVLYISNNHESIEDVNNFFKANSLDSLVCDLTNINTKVSKDNDINDGKYVDSIAIGELETMYDGIKEYNKALYEKVNDFYFLDVMKGLIEYKDVKEEIDGKVFKGIENLYRLESKEVSEALDNIDANLKNIESFKNSMFSKISIRNTSRSKEIIGMLSALSSYYQELIEVKNLIEEKYGVYSISNYAYFRNIINNYNQLSRDLISPNWLEFGEDEKDSKNLKNFEHAKLIFNNLYNEVRESRELEKNLSLEYNTKYLADIDIDEVIDKIDERFNDYNNEDINKFLKNNKALNKRFENIEEDINTVLKNFALIRERLGIKIEYNDKALLESIMPFTFFLKNNNVASAWFDIKNSSGIRKKIVTLSNKLKDYYRLMEFYNKHFKDIKNIDNEIEIITKKSYKNEKYKGILIYDLIRDLDTLKEYLKNIKDINREYEVLAGEKYKEHNDVIKRFDKFNSTLSEIESNDVKNKLIKSLQGLKNNGISEFMKPFDLFFTSYTNIKSLHDALVDNYLCQTKEYIPDIIADIRPLSSFSSYVLENQEKMSKIIKRELSYIPYQEYTVLKSKIENLVKVRNKIKRNLEYKEYFSPLFNGYLTDIETLSKEMIAFNQYVNIFKNNECLLASFDDKVSIELTIELKKAFGICEKIMGLIKGYSKIFTDGLTKFYYDNMASLVEYLNRLIDNEEELKTYLSITKSMRVLLRYRLFAFNEFIINNEDGEDFKERFMFAYYKYLYDLFISTHPNINNTLGYTKLLEDIIGRENDIVNINIEKLRDKYQNKFNLPILKNNDYDKYISKVKGNRYLFLCDSKILNSNINIADFGLVLIDDANLSSSDEYSKALSANQIIIAGNNKNSVNISEDLISKMRKDSIIDLKYRYPKTALSLVENMTRASSTFYTEEEMNEGIEVLKTDACDLIINKIINEDNEIRNDIKINCFVKSSVKQKELYDGISSRLLELGIDDNDILNVLIKNINICDLHIGYIWDANYNIIDLSDYINEVDTYENNYMISLLVCAREKLYIIDNEDYINNHHADTFISKITELTLRHNIISPLSDPVSTRLSQTLSRHGYKILGKYKFYDLVVSKNKRTFGIVLVSAPTNYYSEIINTYREARACDFPCSVVFLQDLVNDYYGYVKKIIGDNK